MEGSTQTRLRRFLDTTGTKPKWLADEVGVSRQRVQSWLAGERPVPAQHRDAIRQALEARQAVPVPADLFEEE